jgi:hypothetical protein
MPLIQCSEVLYRHEGRCSARMKDARMKQAIQCSPAMSCPRIPGIAAQSCPKLRDDEPATELTLLVSFMFEV